MSLRTIGMIVASITLSLNAAAAVIPGKVHVAEAKKSGFYITEGQFVGGDRAVDNVTIKDIRRAPNAGYERLVIDVEGNRRGEPVGIPRPPYFQVVLEPKQERLVFTVWGNPKLGFSAAKVQASLKKSSYFKTVELFPRLDDQSWTFSMGITPGKSIEVFELSNPVRIIVDVKAQR